MCCSARARQERDDVGAVAREQSLSVPKALSTSRDTVSAALAYALPCCVHRIFFACRVLIRDYRVFQVVGYAYDLDVDMYCTIFDAVSLCTRIFMLRAA